MGIEIERKFLLANDSWRSLAPGVRYRQGYITAQPGRTVRIRTIGDRGFLTIKGPGPGAARAEFEYEIPGEDARVLLDTLCEKPLIEKNRHRIDYQGFVWEVDEFLGENQGLVIAEIELSHENQEFTLPPWIGREVTGESRYFNAALVHHPYSRWNREQKYTQTQGNQSRSA